MTAFQCWIRRKAWSLLSEKTWQMRCQPTSQTNGLKTRQKTSQVAHQRRHRGSGRSTPQHSGFTLIEMVVVLAIVGILATAARPLLELSLRRTREFALRESLRTLRGAIDAYKQAVDERRLASPADASGYPPTLEALVQGVPELEGAEAAGASAAALDASSKNPAEANPALDSPDLHPFGLSSSSLATLPKTDVRRVGGTSKRLYFLRRLPRDPFADAALTAAQSWGLRGYGSSAEAPAAGKEVFDVYSRSDGMALDGSRLRDW